MATHDYTEPKWGHAVHGAKAGDVMQCQGHGNGIGKGDTILLKGKRFTIHYRVNEIKYYRDPDDMWEATLEKFAYTDPATGEYYEIPKGVA